jgi:penicillin-binding protein 2
MVLLRLYSYVFINFLSSAMKLRNRNTEIPPTSEERADPIFGDYILGGRTQFSRGSAMVEGFDTFLGNSGGDRFSENRLGRIISEKIWFYFIGLAIITVSVVLVRAAFLQLYEGNSYRVLAEENRIREIPILPKRGIIYDSQGEVITTNAPLFLLTLRGVDLPRSAENRASVFALLREQGAQFDIRKAEEQLLIKPDVILTELSYAEALKFMTITQDLEGVEVVLYERREYINPEKFSHVIGYLGPVSESDITNLTDNYLINDFLGKTGVELIYEEELRGTLGKRNVEVDSKGKEKTFTTINDPIDGYNLHLTIDKVVQEKIYSLLDDALKNYDTKKASVIVTDPMTGEIISLVSYPSFDNQQFYQGIESEPYQKLLTDPDQPLFNRSISGQYPPGSTFKTILATAGLDTGKITPNTTYLSTGGIRVSQWFFPDWRAGGHGATNVYKAIADSVNTFFYILGGGYDTISGIGVDKIREYAIAFGLLKPTGIDLTNEASGFFPSPQWKREVKNEQWYIGDTYNLSIGQGDVLVTPIQMTMVTAAIANGGTLYKPHLLKYFSTRDNVIIGPGEDWIIHEQVADPGAIAVVKRAMRETVLTGSATSMQIVPTLVSGKTGTAQWHSTKDPHGWFIGFAPYDEPEIAFTVLVEESGGGNTTAVPIARNFLTWYFTEYKESL